MNQQQLIQELERLTDASTLFNVIMALSLICNEKAEHIAATYQDRSTAKPWSAASKQLVAVARKTTI